MAIAFPNLMLELVPSLMHQAVQDVLGTSLDAIEQGDWSLRDRIQIQESHILTMGLSNPEWMSLVVLGASKGSLELVPDGLQDLDMALDACGEILNTIGGVIAVQNPIIAQLGELVQGPPVFCSSNISCPRAPSIWGRVHRGSLSLALGWSWRAALSPAMQRAIAQMGPM